MPKPDTVIDAIAFLASAGYVDDYRLCTEAIVDTSAAAIPQVTNATVDYTFRFEGSSDPSDQAIVLGVHCAGGRKGVVVSAYGPDADAAPETAALLVALAQ